MSPNVDLSQLAVRRDGASSTPRTRRSWHAGTRIVLPGLVLLGFVAVVGWAARDRLLPATPVTVISVVTTHLDVQSEGTPIFQAAGWIEPRPTPILVTALTEGVVEKLLVVEGQTIQAGEPVAHLIQDDARLALQTADADLELRQAEVDNVKATLTLAKAMLPLQLKAARSRLALAKESLDARTRAAELGASPLLALPLARSEVEVAASAVAELELKENGIKAEGLRPFAELEANVKAASTRAKLAEIAVAAARLRLDRTVIKAPVAGQVMTLIARPGQRLMGQSPLGHQEASTIIAMFDPGMLQVRADVRLDDIRKVQPGQLVKIQAPVTADALDGEVLRITSQADIQKNTLQVKIAVKTPPPSLRPDMLVQATFLAPATPKGADESKQALRLMIPKQLVETSEGNTHVWTAVLVNKVARKKAVTLGRSIGDFVEVTQGLNAADRLIHDGRQGLSDGQRIAVTYAE